MFSTPAHATRVILFFMVLVAGPTGARGAAAPAAERPTSRPAARPARAEERCLSLAELARRVAKAREAGKAPEKAALHLGGITRFDGYYIDPDAEDLVLYGRREPDAPPLHLDDLAVIFDAALGRRPIY